MESVEYLMVAVAANLVFMVNESVMDVLLGDKFRHKSAVLCQYGLKSVELGLLFPVNTDPVSFFKTFPYVFGKKLEVLVEDRLRRYVELYCILVLTGQRKLHV